jgi:hypothetical protein
MQAQANATTIQVLVRRETLNLRAIDRIIQSDVFVDAWRQATVQQREQLLQVLGNKDLAGVKRWVDAVGPRNVADLSYRDLRDLAQRHLVPRYSRLDKEQLITALRGINDDSIAK